MTLLGEHRYSLDRLSEALWNGSAGTAMSGWRDHQIADGLADLYLDLDLRGVSMLDFSDVAAVARRGYEAAMPRLEEWLSSREG